MVSLHTVFIIFFQDCNHRSYINLLLSKLQYIEKNIPFKR